MPVEDHEVHEKVKISANKPYGCYDRTKMAEGYYAPDRVYRPDGTFYVIQTWIPNAMSKSCRNFYLWTTDLRCEGCLATKDFEYANKMQGLE